MSDLPSGQPRWANSGADITEPSEPQKSVGWDTSDLFRQYLNWWMNLAYQWIAWLAQIVFRFSDFGADQALPTVGTPPAAGVGLNILANVFSARAFIDGYPMGLITGPTANYTYSTNSDTYWDLGRDGVWYPSVVAAVAAAPALAANRVRVYKVRTNLLDRVAVTDFRPFAVSLNKTLDISTILHGDSNLATAADAAIARQVTRYRRGHNASYTHVHSFLDRTDAVAQTQVLTLPANPDDSVTYAVVINGTTITTAALDGTSTKAELNAALLLAINASAVPVTASVTGVDVLLTADAAGTAFTISIGGANSAVITLGAAVANVAAGQSQSGSTLYVREATDELVMVRGCTWSGTQWVTQVGSPATYSMESLNGSTKTSRVLDAAIAGSPFNDSVWFAAMVSGNGIFKAQAFDAGLTAGLGLATAYEHSEIAAYQSVPLTASSDPRCLSANFGSLKIYSHGAPNNGIGGDGRGGATVSNARYASGSNQWARIAAGDAYAVVSDSGGIKFLRRAAGAASPWNDSIDATNGWTRVLHASSVFQPDTVLPIQVTASPSVPHTLYRSNIVKAFGSYVLDSGPGDFTSSSFFGCSAAVVGTDVVVTFDNVMASARYHVEVSVGTQGYSGHATSRAAGGFTIKASLSDPFTPVDQSSSGLELSFSVVGLQA